MSCLLLCLLGWMMWCADKKYVRQPKAHSWHYSCACEHCWRSLRPHCLTLSCHHVLKRTGILQQTMLVHRWKQFVSSVDTKEYIQKLFMVWPKSFWWWLTRVSRHGQEFSRLITRRVWDPSRPLDIGLPPVYDPQDFTTFMTSTVYSCYSVAEVNFSCGLYQNMWSYCRIGSIVRTSYCSLWPRNESR